MKLNWLVIGLLAFSIVGIVAGYILFHAFQFNICGQSLFCTDLMNKGNALFYSMQAIGAVFLVLLFVPQAFSAWKKFAIWFLPLMFIYFAIYKNEGFFSIPEESIYRFLSIVYVLVSLILISLTALRKRKSE